MTLTPRDAWEEALRQLPELSSLEKYKLWAYDKVNMMLGKSGTITLSKVAPWVNKAVSILMRKVWEDSIEFSTEE